MTLRGKLGNKNSVTSQEQASTYALRFTVMVSEFFTFLDMMHILRANEKDYFP